MIPLKRLQQGIFQAAAAMNRAESTGGGSGYVPLLPLVNLDTGTISQSFTGIGIGNSVQITNSSATFILPRAQFVFVTGSPLMAVTAGTGFAYIYIDIDGTKYGINGVSGDGPKGYYTASLIAAPLLSRGSHTVSLKGYVSLAGTTGFCVAALVILLQSGA